MESKPKPDTKVPLSLKVETVSEKGLVTFKFNYPIELSAEVLLVIYDRRMLRQSE